MKDVVEIDIDYGFLVIDVYFCCGCILDDVSIVDEDVDVVMVFEKSCCGFIDGGFFCYVEMNGFGLVFGFFECGGDVCGFCKIDIGNYYCCVGQFQLFVDCLVDVVCVFGDECDVFVEVKIVVVVYKVVFFVLCMVFRVGQSV